MSVDLRMVATEARRRGAKLMLARRAPRVDKCGTAISIVCVAGEADPTAAEPTGSTAVGCASVAGSDRIGWPLRGLGLVTRRCKMDRSDLIKPTRHSREDLVLTPILYGCRMSVSSRMSECRKKCRMSVMGVGRSD
eukprot:2928302-Pyramimonas_sp.AAC.1